MVRTIFVVLVTLLILVASCQKAFQDHDASIDLSGTWSFQPDSANVGIQGKWFNKQFGDSVKLPGTTDENKKGIYLDERAIDRLSRVWYWKGAAWYQKEVLVPESWEGKNVKLLLERTKDTHVWFNDTYCGYENSLSAPQYFDLSGAIKPGKQRITILVDNAKLPPVGPSHAVDERTQTNWNGIVGKMELQMTDPVWIEEVQVYPDIRNNRAKVRVSIGNRTEGAVEGELKVTAESWNLEDAVQFKNHREEIQLAGKDKVVEFFYHFDKEAPLWDEFNPALIKLNLTLITQGDNKKYRNLKQVDFGMREFTREGKFLYNNGRRVFLRGRLDCANYPLTGYPPMDRQSWVKMFEQLKSYGINHWRFHSWFPPEEALMAADMTGIYLQPELPNKRSGMDSKSMDDEVAMKLYNADYMQVETSIINMTLKDYLQKEGEMIFRYFGNHPSFVMFTLGNELGRNEAMYELVAHFKNTDPRRLYAQGSNNMHWELSLAEGDDFWVTAKTSAKLPVRGAFFHGDYAKGHIENLSPSTLINYSESLEIFPVPVIGHEIGAFQVSPDFNDIAKFTGVTRARNYEIFRERFEKAGLLDQADDFVKASGKLAVICYREDIEAALRTPDFGGFQLLDIQDFPGQGTALVGILNDFMEPKGLITPEEWSQFCSEVVPLLKMEKYTWTSNEQFKGKIEIAHYGKDDFNDAVINWQVINRKGETLSTGNISKDKLARGGVAEVGEISFPLDRALNAEKLQIVIAVEGTKYKNVYDFWVYPQSVNASVPEGILVSERLDSKTAAHLERGGKAIIIPDHDELTHCIGGAFQTDYWSYPMFARAARNRGIEPAPGSLGFICDPESPLLKHFPTEYHSNWQWWHLVKNCKSIILDETPADYKPLIQTIDNFDRVHKLGMVFETKYGKGSALICAIDLLNLQDKPEARQLYYSIIKYVESENFSPVKEIDKLLLKKIIP